MTVTPVELHHLTARQRRVLAWVATACATLFVLLAVTAARSGASDVDQLVKTLVQADWQPAFARTMRRISLLGSGYVLFPLTVVLSLLLARRHLRLALTAPLVAGGAVIVETVAKVATGRPRPNSVAYSYPSAHVLGAMVFFGMLVYVLWALAHRRRWWQATAALSSVIVVVIAYSRLYVNAHWISDVAGGFTGGLAYVLIVVLMLDAVTRPLPATATAPSAAARRSAPPHTPVG
jgi:membrane-associated phospholipid phosphatase